MRYFKNLFKEKKDKLFLQMRVKKFKRKVKKSDQLKERMRKMLI